MVIDPHFPTCTIRNVLSRICGADALWVINVLAENVSVPMEVLCREMRGLNYQQIASAIRILMEDRIVDKSNNEYRLSPLGKSMLPYIKGLVAWCEMQIK